MSSTILSEEGLAPRGVLGLDDPASSDPDVSGAKASALATARHAGLRVLDGFVISTTAVAAWQAADRAPSWLLSDLRTAWAGLAARDSVIVRSSSPNEDAATSSMAGQFRSVLNVTTWNGLLEAIGQVIDSSDGAPMAVLVQPFIEPPWGGVLFGADPVTGRQDRLLVAAVPGGPDRLVSGAVTGTQFALSTRGRMIDTPAAMPDLLARRSLRKAFVKLATANARLFGEPRDIEWALDDDGRLLLLQSRPISAIGHEVEAEGPVLGPGPLTETFPAPLATLEEDLWIPPLREGLRRALDVIGVVPARRLRASPIVATVGGRPALDLDLLQLSPVRRTVWARLDPRPPARRFLASWRIGRLRAALPMLAADIAREVDAELKRIPALERLAADELVTLLERSAEVLTSLHGYEVLAGQLLDTGATPTTAMSRALDVLAKARTVARDDGELVAEHPVLLSLVPPAIGQHITLPPAPPLASIPRAGSPPRSAGRGHRDPDGAATARESLRLRIRWVHELTARAALELGHQLVRQGFLAQPVDVRNLRLHRLRRAIASDRLETMDATTPAPAGPPLPSAFRRAGDAVVPVIPADSGRTGRGAGGGRGMGRVHTSTADPPAGAVLIVGTLDPNLAPLLPKLSGLVAETGSVLSHLAILAREYGVPTVVDLPDATQRYSPGAWVVVDGSTGEVSAMESAEWRAA